MYCSFTVKSLWFSRFCSVWFDSTHVRYLSLLAFTFFMFYVEIFAVSACGYWVDFAAFYDEVIVISMVNCCDNYGEFLYLFLLSHSLIISTLLAVNYLRFSAFFVQTVCLWLLIFCIFIEDVSGPPCHHCICLCFEYGLELSFPLKRLILVSYPPSLYLLGSVVWFLLFPIC